MRNDETTTPTIRVSREWLEGMKRILEKSPCLSRTCGHRCPTGDSMITNIDELLHHVSQAR